MTVKCHGGGGTMWQTFRFDAQWRRRNTGQNVLKKYWNPFVMLSVPWPKFLLGVEKRVAICDFCECGFLLTWGVCSHWVLLTLQLFLVAAINVDDVRKCMGDPEADQDNPILKNEQDAQVRLCRLWNGFKFCPPLELFFNSIGWLFVRFRPLQFSTGCFAIKINNLSFTCSACLEVVFEFEWKAT